MQLLELQQSPYPHLESLSPFCLKVHRALKAAGLPYQSEHAPYPAAHATPTRQVPALRVGDSTLHDSTQILAFISEQAPNAFADHPETWLWEELADTSINGFVVAARWADPRNWPLVREAYFAAVPRALRRFVSGKVRRNVLRGLHARDVTRAGHDACCERFATLLARLEGRAPQRGFWLGERLTVADIGLFAQLHSLRTPLTQPQAETIARHPRLSEYLDRVDGATNQPRVRLAA